MKLCTAVFLFLCIVPVSLFANEIESVSDRIASELQSQVDEGIMQGATLSVFDRNSYTVRTFGKASDGQDVEADHQFMIASVSKVITALAVFRLAEEGTIDLQADIRRYLDYDWIDDSKGTIRVIDLLTHTAGFDESLYGIAAKSPAEVPTLLETLSQTMPPQVRSPGKYYSYSNHGYTLAGLLIQEVSGMPFRDYIHEKIMDPIGMNSSMVQYVDPYIEERSGRGLVSSFSMGNQVSQLPFNPVAYEPAGSFISTAADMARFGQFHLGADVSLSEVFPGGLSPIHDRVFSSHQDLAGTTAGFYIQYRYGNRILLHGGDWMGFNTLLVVIPERNIGFFLASNGTSDLFFRETIVEDLIRNHYRRQQSDDEFPGFSLQNLEDYNPDRHEIEGLARYAGQYRFSRYPRTNRLKLAGLAFQATVSHNPDLGYLTFTLPLIGEQWNLVPDGSDRFRYILNDDEGHYLSDSLLVFEEAERSSSGNSSYDRLMTDFFLPMEFERVSDFSHPYIQMSLFLFVSLGYLFILFSPLYHRLIFRRKYPDSIQSGNFLRLVAFFSALWFFLTLVAYVVIIALNPLTLASVPLLEAVGFLPWMSALSGFILVASLLKVQKMPWHGCEKFVISFSAINTVIYILFMVQWNLW